MTDELPNDNEEDVPMLAAASPLPEFGPDVTLIIPAPPYVAVATVDVFESAAAPMPGPEDSARALEAVAALGETLGRKLDGLLALFDREVRAEATREKVVDRLHAELQEYKQDLLLNVLRPMFVDLIQFHDNIGKMVAAQTIGEENGEARRLLDLMRDFQQEIEDILYRQGVEPFQADGETFDPKRQRAVATVPTDDPGLAKTIAARLRKGFQAGEKIIRPEIVSVHTARR